MPTPEGLAGLAAIVERMFDDEGYYQSYVAKAAKQAPIHSLEANTRALIQALQPLLRPREVTIPIAPERGITQARPDFAPLDRAERTEEVAASPAQRILVNSFVGGFGSMGRVGEALLRHL